MPSFIRIALLACFAVISTAIPGLAETQARGPAWLQPDSLAVALPVSQSASPFAGLRVAQAEPSGPLAADARLNNPPPPPEQSRSEGQPIPRGEGVTAYITYKTPYEFYLTFLTVALGVAFIGLFCFVHRGKAVDYNFSRHFIIITVIFAALYLIVAGYSEKQTAPVFGLLGTIVGYMFGVIASGSGSEGRSGPQPLGDGKSTGKDS